MISVAVTFIICSHCIVFINGIFNTSLVKILSDELITQYNEKILLPKKILCANRCHLEKQCLAFAYHNGTQECYMYHRMIVANDPRSAKPGLITFITEMASENRALNQLTKQISTLGVGFSSKAVDGVKSETHKTQTTETARSWWCVDLGMNNDVAWIFIFNRQNYAHRIKWFDVSVSSTAGCDEGKLNTSSLCYKNDGSVRKVYTISQCNQPSPGLNNVRSIYITVPNNILHMEEVEVYPKTYC